MTEILAAALSVIPAAIGAGQGAGRLSAKRGCETPNFTGVGRASQRRDRRTQLEEQGD